MHTRCTQKFFILFNLLATLSQHLPPRWPHQQIATIIVSATAVATKTTTTTTTVTAATTSEIAGGTAAAATTAAEPATAARTTSASAFVDEVLPHNDSVATTTLHAKSIDSDGSNKAMHKNSNSINNNNSNADDFEQLLAHKLQEEAMEAMGPSATPDHLLSRKRRYLIFPEGSSFQLVYDGIYGIVDYTNYLILGITVALAWELPSKPQSEVIEEIANRLKDGRLEVRRNDTSTRITYVDTKKNQTQTTTKQQQTYQSVNTLRPTYIDLMTLTSPAAAAAAAKKSDQKYYYANTGQLPATFHAPLHQKYYYYKGSNKYDNSKSHYGKYHMLRRPIDSYYHRTQVTPRPTGGYYKQRPNDWRRKDTNYYYGATIKYRQTNNSKSNNNKGYNLSTLKVNPFSKSGATHQRRLPSALQSYTPQAKVGRDGVGSQYPWWNLATRLSNSLRRKPIPSRRIDGSSSQAAQRKQHQQPARQLKQQQQQSASGFYRQPPATARKHRIYPVFGKRSIADEPPTAVATAAEIHSNNNNNTQQQQAMPHHRQRRSGIVGPELTRIERIHIRHHRSTRQTLYEKIEKYLDKLGIKNSHQCILRALCETGQKSKERSPGTFVGEIMRAVFTVPEALDEDLLENRIHYKDQRYDRANGFEGSCNKQYALCEQSLWETEFVK
ncbi:uncharacterized protein LOC118744781 [Rhagoletis pomonella]|uniref:uncharacterized protein LOC118744781 n=1 Tax=Rhagoletis pomonella TaxID=28610 RepID=UPI00178210F6|nr:uncharacterized protein LOC118744781 [Rhagoletis pomonella]